MKFKKDFPNAYGYLVRLHMENSHWQEIYWYEAALSISFYLNFSPRFSVFYNDDDTVNWQATHGQFDIKYFSLNSEESIRVFPLRVFTTAVNFHCLEIVIRMYKFVARFGCRINLSAQMCGFCEMLTGQKLVITPAQMEKLTKLSVPPNYDQRGITHYRYYLVGWLLDFAHQDRWNTTPLHVAIESDDVRSLEYFLEVSFNNFLTAQVFQQRIQQKYQTPAVKNFDWQWLHRVDLNYRTCYQLVIDKLLIINEPNDPNFKIMQQMLEQLLEHEVLNDLDDETNELVIRYILDQCHKYEAEYTETVYKILRTLFKRHLGVKTYIGEHGNDDDKVLQRRCSAKFKKAKLECLGSNMQSIFHKNGYRQPTVSKESGTKASTGTTLGGT